MPYLRTAPEATRFFARLDHFECECPSCGRLIIPSKNDWANALSRARATDLQTAPARAKSRKHWDLTWNPVTQRVKCEGCGRRFVAGLLLYSVPPGSKVPLDPPPDVIPTVRELAVLRQHAGGWWATTTYERGGHVNVVVTSPCVCPENGWAERCPVHGDPTLAAVQGVNVRQSG